MKGGGSWYDTPSIGHLALLHALEERGLRLRRGAVDLVDEKDVREDGARPELELVRALVEDVDARDVRGQKVRGELQARKGAVHGPRDRLGEARLPHPREVLDDQVTLGQKAEDRELQRLVRRVHDALKICDDAVGQLGGTARLEARICSHSLLVHSRPSQECLDLIEDSHCTFLLASPA